MAVVSLRAVSGNHGKKHKVTTSNAGIVESFPSELKKLIFKKIHHWKNLPLFNPRTVRLGGQAKISTGNPKRHISRSNLCSFTWQCGQTKPLIFSAIPRTFTFILLQKLSSLRMVASATSWGVVTTTAPSGLTFFKAFTTVRCSSDVPGGVSKVWRKWQ